MFTVVDWEAHNNNGADLPIALRTISCGSDVKLAPFWYTTVTLTVYTLHGWTKISTVMCWDGDIETSRRRPSASAYSTRCVRMVMLAAVSQETAMPSGWLTTLTTGMPSSESDCNCEADWKITEKTGKLISHCPCYRCWCCEILVFNFILSLKASGQMMHSAKLLEMLRCYHIQTNSLIIKKVRKAWPQFIQSEVASVRMGKPLSYIQIYICIYIHVYT